MDEYLLDSYRNVIRTDGVDIEFLFKKMKATRDEPTPADFKDWLEYRGDGVTIWGVDPGVTDMFVAVDDGASLEDTDACRIRKTSTKEYYDLCGYNVASEKRSRWKREDAETASVIDKIPSFKTTNLPALTAAIQYVMANFQTITAHYDQQFRYNVLKLTTYKARQKGLSEIGRRLTYGSKKYGMEPKPRHSHTAAELAIGTGSQFKPLPSKDRPEDNSRRHVILAYGNAAIGNVRSKLPAPSKALVHHLRQVMKCKGCFLSVVMIDEYLTSQVCAKCHQRTVSKVQERPTRGGHYKNRIHAVLKCENCRTTWNRDVMAAKNMAYVFKYMSRHNNQRPLPFRRPSPILSRTSQEEASTLIRNTPVAGGN